MNRLNIYIGNTNCTAGNEKYAGNTKNIPLLEDIFSDDFVPDVIILDEFYKWKDFENFQNEFLKKGYRTQIDLSYGSKGNDVNDVFIGLSSKLEHFNIIKVEHSVRIRDRKEPDYTSVILENETDKIAIIGVRIRSYKNINYKGNSNDFQQLIELIQRLKEQGIANFIIGGDFNHARVLGDREKNLSENEINKIYKGFAQLPHNYHKIKRELYENDLRLYTPKGNSYPINSFRKFPFIPDDHLISFK